VSLRCIWPRLYPQAEVRGIDVSTEKEFAAPPWPPPPWALPAHLRSAGPYAMPAELSVVEARGTGHGGDLLRGARTCRPARIVLLRHAAEYLAPGGAAGRSPSPADRARRSTATSATAGTSPRRGCADLLEASGFEEVTDPTGRVPVLRPVPARRHPAGEAPGRRRRADRGYGARRWCLGDRAAPLRPRLPLQPGLVPARLAVARRGPPLWLVDSCDHLPHAP
jgi:hypothetical protein